MNETTAVVRSVAGDEAVVEVERTGCGRCDQPGGCGGAGKADLFCHARIYRVLNPLGAHVGDRVNIAIASGAISASATRAYVVPLALVFLGALLGRVVADNSIGEAMTIAGALAGLALGWGWLRGTRHADVTVERPTIVAKF